MRLRRTSYITVLTTALLAEALAQGQPGRPKIGSIDFYGLKKVPEARVRKALGAAEGGLLPPSKGWVEDKLTEVPGIVAARLEATCCDDHGDVILYIGVEEKGAAHFDLRSPPEGTDVLPEDLVATYREFLIAVAEAVRHGVPAEDLTRGHSLMADPDARAYQTKFVELAEKHLKELRNVLRTSSDDEQRAIAAYMIGYAPKKGQVVDDLQYALKDFDDTVRGNAVRALAAISVYATLNPESGIKISPTWFVEMLNSISWTDRNNAAVALVNLTEKRDQATLDQIKERALPALQEMSKWHHLAHALPAFILVGRVKGMPEEEIQEAWKKR